MQRKNNNTVNSGSELEISKTLILTGDSIPRHRNEREHVQSIAFQRWAFKIINIFEYLHYITSTLEEKKPHTHKNKVWN